MITRGVRGRRIGEDLALGTREELGERLAAGADAGEPTLPGASGGGLHVLGGADGAEIIPDTQ